MILLRPSSAVTKMMSSHSWAPVWAPDSPRQPRHLAQLRQGRYSWLEELVRRFGARTTVTTLCASGSAIAVARLLLGNGPNFQLEPLLYLGFGTVLIFVVLGAVTGLIGVA